MTEEIPRSAIFDTNEKYLTHLRNSIAMLDGIVLRGEDIVVEGSMATRILLDFYWETLRRTLESLENTKENTKEKEK